jgi:hypothetical protein
MDTLSFKENGDGTVTIGLPASYPISLTMTPEDEPHGTIGMTVSQINLTVIASGTPDNISFALAGESLSVVMDSIEMDGEPAPEVAMDLTFAGLSGNYSLGSGDMRAVSSSLNAATVSLNLDVSEPDGAGTFHMDGQVANLSSSSSGVMPGAVPYSDMAAMLAAGFNASGTMNYGAGEFTMDFEDEGDSFASSGTVASGGLDFAMGDGGISYNTRSTGLDMELSGSAIPMPSVKRTVRSASMGSRFLSLCWL